MSQFYRRVGSTFIASIILRNFLYKNKLHCFAIWQCVFNFWIKWVYICSFGSVCLFVYMSVCTFGLKTFRWCQCWHPYDLGHDCVTLNNYYVKKHGNTIVGTRNSAVICKIDRSALVFHTQLSVMLNCYKAVHIHTNMWTVHIPTTVFHMTICRTFRFIFGAIRPVWC